MKIPMKRIKKEIVQYKSQVKSKSMNRSKHTLIEELKAVVFEKIISKWVGILGHVYTKITFWPIKIPNPM